LRFERISLGGRRRRFVLGSCSGKLLRQSVPVFRRGDRGPERGSAAPRPADAECDEACTNEEHDDGADTGDHEPAGGYGVRSAERVDVDGCGVLDEHVDSQSNRGGDEQKAQEHHLHGSTQLPRPLRPTDAHENEDGTRPDTLSPCGVGVSCFAWCRRGACARWVDELLRLVGREAAT
jgi:hypothetical protein